MESRKALVDRAITFRRPERVPIVFWNRDQIEGDVMLYHLSLGVPGDGDVLANAWDWSTNEWGYHLTSLDDGTMGHPTEAQRMYNLLATDKGGFIGYVEEYGCMGMSDENYRACGEAFRRLPPGKHTCQTHEV